MQEKKEQRRCQGGGERRPEEKGKSIRAIERKEVQRDDPIEYFHTEIGVPFESERG